VDFLKKIFNNIRGVFGEGNDELLFFMILFLLLPASNASEDVHKRTGAFDNSNVVFIIVLVFLFLIIDDKKK